MRKPTKPVLPSQTVNVETIINSYDDDVVLSIAKLQELGGDTIRLRIEDDYYDGSRYVELSLIKTTTKPNPSYDKEVARYEKAVIRYEKDMAAYEVYLEGFKKKEAVRKKKLAKKKEEEERALYLKLQAKYGGGE